MLVQDHEIAVINIHTDQTTRDYQPITSKP
jgi:hypothetical protein